MAKKLLKKIDYAEMVNDSVSKDHMIGNDIALMNKHILDPVFDYEFTATGNTFIEVIEGFGKITVNGVAYDVKAPCILAYLNGQTIKTSITSGTVVQRSAVFSDKFLEDVYMNALKFNDIRSTVLENPVIPIKAEVHKSLDLYVSALQTIAARKNNDNNLTCAKMVTLALFYGALYESFKKKIQSETFRTPKISSDFFNLLQKNFRKEHRMGFYAHELGISERYLYLTVVSSTGKSPSYWIDYYLISEAKKLLQNRNYSITQVMNELHFAGLPSFGKFFLRKEGTSPSLYRKKLTKI